jgi:hypothetical protein
MNLKIIKLCITKLEKNLIIRLFSIILIIAGIISLVVIIIHHSEKVPIEPPIYIIKTRVEVMNKTDNIPINAKIGDVSQIILQNMCGKFFIINRQLSYSNQQELGEKFSALYNVFLEKPFYSVSIFTERKTGTLTLDVHSFQTDFSIEHKSAIINLKQQNEGWTGLNEKIFEIDLNLQRDIIESSLAKVLFVIIPNKDLDMTVECIGINNCTLIEDTIKLYILSDDAYYFNYYTNNDKNISSIVLPYRNYNEMEVYLFDFESNNFLKLGSELFNGSKGILAINDTMCQNGSVNFINLDVK